MLSVGYEAEREGSTFGARNRRTTSMRPERTEHMQENLQAAEERGLWNTLQTRAGRAALF